MSRICDNKGVRVHFGVGGVKGIDKTRVTRLCIYPGRSSIVEDRVRLGKFRGVCLRPKRRGRIVLRLSREDFSICSMRGGTFSVLDNGCRVYVKTSMRSLRLGTGVRMMKGDCFEGRERLFPSCFERRPRKVRVDTRRFCRLLNNRPGRSGRGGHKRCAICSSCRSIMGISVFKGFIHKVMRVKLGVVLQKGSRQSPTFGVMGVKIRRKGLRNLVTADNKVTAPGLVSVLICGTGGGCLRTFGELLGG